MNDARYYVNAVHKDAPAIGRMVDYWRVMDGQTGMRANGTAMYATAGEAQDWCDALNAENIQ